VKRERRVRRKTSTYPCFLRHGDEENSVDDGEEASDAVRLDADPQNPRDDR
jgi:hypothetical protein